MDLTPMKLTLKQRNEIYCRIYRGLHTGHYNYVCWKLSKAVAGDDSRYDPYWHNSRGDGKEAMRLLSAEFPEFAMFKPRNKSVGEPWFGYWHEDKEMRRLAVAFCIAMTGGMKC